MSAADRALLALAELPGARCRENDPEIWFSESRSNIEYVKAECGRCPVAQQCMTAVLDLELETNQTMYGIFGGLTERERRRFRLNRKKETA